MSGAHEAPSPPHDPWRMHDRPLPLAALELVRLREDNERGKAVAALRSGMSKVVLPGANANDLELLPQEVRDQVVFDLVRTMDEVMDAVLVESPLRVRSPASETGVGVSASHG